MRQRDAHLKQGLHDLGPVVADVRGAGLLVDSGPDGDRAVDVQQAAREQGVLVNAVAPDVIRLAPPLTVSADEVHGFLDRFAPVLREAAGPQPAAA
ncbi:aminotransferase class III-fold pyridoxal phosphate-dependent enzyme [Streptomyces sp. NPDC086783]|uniref:aminotransferase class III-fold pyridoxal phosphate-dependent enzyme n=1 Tax=Streptomyces sp. NPDC086783 TaxID=3365758 RepID=UPI00380E501D